MHFSQTLAVIDGRVQQKSQKFVIFVIKENEYGIQDN